MSRIGHFIKNIWAIHCNSLGDLRHVWFQHDANKDKTNIQKKPTSVLAFLYHKIPAIFAMYFVFS
jgi:hypothetical protein